MSRIFVYFRTAHHLTSLLDETRIADDAKGMGTTPTQLYWQVPYSSSSTQLSPTLSSATILPRAMCHILEQTLALQLA
ncbi:hypothetical protein P5673_025749 [Acropora cervicornis]|uniref:Uncharacterized protein n=1 Tax=Acropora cervicornis TaxID=6130 RepID=A0AAD9Q292_ACRCE|nr:hypothetical protein P5673_025749 [Acropora cervicornis]